VGVQVEDDEGALVVGVGDGGGGGEDVVGGDGAGGEEAGGGGEELREVVVHGADGGEGGLCMAEVVEVDDEDSVAEGFGLEGSYVSEGLEFGAEGRVGGDGERREEEGAGGGRGEVRWRRRRKRVWEG